MRKHSGLIVRAYLAMMAGWTGLAFTHKEQYRDTLADVFSVGGTALFICAVAWLAIVGAIGTAIIKATDDPEEDRIAVRIAHKLEDRLMPPFYVYGLIFCALIWNLMMKALVLVILNPGDQGD